jgi:hypothetical protein
VRTTDLRRASDGTERIGHPRPGRLRPRRGGHPRARHRLTANLFGIPLGPAGVAQCWTVAHEVGTAPDWPADVLWVLVAGRLAARRQCLLRPPPPTGRPRARTGRPSFITGIELFVDGGVNQA